MSTQDFSNIIVAVLPFLAALAYFVARVLEQRLPEKQRAALDQFVALAVKNVEQELSMAQSSHKKEVALKVVEQFFRYFRLPLPDAALIDAAVEAAVFDLNALQQPKASVTVTTPEPAPLGPNKGNDTQPLKAV